MPALSRTVRRFIMHTLYDRGPMSLVEIQETVRVRFRSKDVPSIVSLSGGLRSPVFVNCASIKIEGRECAVVRMNNDLVRERDDIVRVLAYAHLFKDEREGVRRCLVCNQSRVMYQGQIKCLRCQR